MWGDLGGDTVGGHQLINGGRWQEDISRSASREEKWGGDDGTMDLRAAGLRAQRLFLPSRGTASAV